MSDLRARLGKLLDSIDDDTVAEIVKDALDARKLVWATMEPWPCPHCGEKIKGKKIKVDYPDLDKRAKVLSVLLDQAKGKPSESRKIEVDITARRIEEMSTEELDAIIEGRARELTAGK